ncbi:MAG: hypothetical protein EPO21_19990 [Chloroflexota bacterium]|nr:MAG: hypothetical protein EPO21_19990 [Chloroflexota bacterium]
MTPSIQKRALSAIGYSFVETGTTSVVGFARAILLARLLSPDDFGIITFALFFANLIGTLTPFSLDQAFIQGDVDDEEKTASTVLAVDVVLAGCRFGLILLLSPLFDRLFPSYPLLPVIMPVLFAAYILGAACNTPLALLKRRIVYRRIAAMNIAISISLTVVTVLMASAGFGLWSLVAEQVLGRVMMFVALFLIRPPWRLRWGLDRSLVRRFRGFSLAVSATDLLSFLIDRFDDFWTGAFLGKQSLGFYSKAYEFAGYPRRALSDPIGSVSFPLFSRLQHSRAELSQGFTRTLGFLVRAGFLVAILLFLLAPQFIELLLGSKWLSMVAVFQLMVIYTLVDPLMGTVGGLFVAVGKPAVLTKVRLLQMLTFVPAVVVLGSRLDIEGVAMAADLMAIVGFVVLLWQVRGHVDFSLRRMFLTPILAAVVAGLVVYEIGIAVPLADSIPLQLAVKSAAAALVYGMILVAFERTMYREYAAYLKTVVGERAPFLKSRRSRSSAELPHVAD